MNAETARMAIEALMRLVGEEHGVEIELRKKEEDNGTLCD